MGRPLNRNALILAGIASLLVAIAVVSNVGWRRHPAPPANPADAEIPDHVWAGVLIDLTEPAIAFRDIERDSKYGFVNRRGEVVIEPKYDWAGDFENKLAIVRIGARLEFVDVLGNERFMLPEGTDRTERSEGMIWFHHGKGNQWGLINETGRLILEPTYDQVLPFSEGLAAVNLGTEWVQLISGVMPKGGKWGFIDSQGERVIPIQFKSINSFSDGLARATDDDGCKYLDRSGKVVIGLGEWGAGDFREGLAPIVIHDSDPLTQDSTRFINHRGETQFRIVGGASEFHDGLARVSIKDTGASSFRSFIYIDRHGKTVIAERFADAKDFSDGLAAVKVETNRDPSEKLWGYIDKSGRYRIAPTFNEVTAFRDGIAKVHIDGKLQFVEDGPSYWQGGDWWLVNRKGQKLKLLGY